MHCIYCNKPVFGANGMTVPTLGAAHQTCFQADQALKRTFQKLDITKLTDDELFELKEMIRIEENQRARAQDPTKNDLDNGGDIELF